MNPTQDMSEGPNITGPPTLPIFAKRMVTAFLGTEGTRTWLALFQPIPSQLDHVSMPAPVSLQFLYICDDLFNNA